ncbi:AAA domain-containing protein [Pleomorphovibrio marinus]|uniref:AAA domain-containing protein n=1 Tax=Pleomorphovibrio marinus TaxID=2164132 RepID=UPI000E0B7813|nr:AAA domain-containing protein [Pleomorphovibrio marinus]
MLQDVFQVYRNRLLDLSSNNRSIFLPKLVQQQMIDLKDFHFLNNHPSFFYITELLGRKRNIPLIQVNDARDKNVNQLSQRLKRLYQNVRFAEEETGERNLFVGWPFVEGKLMNDQLIRCPLIFFPINLHLEDNIWYLRKNMGELPFLNPSFLLAYGQAQGKSLDREWLDQSLEDFTKEPRGFRTDLYHHLHKALVINFNRDIYQDKLEFFSEGQRANFESEFETGKLKLMPYAVLGQFSQKSSSLMDDYDRLIHKNPFKNLDALFSYCFVPSNEISRASKEDNLYHTLPLDSSQEVVLKHVKQGGSGVVQGPPGTGKSQLIANLVSDFISRGKKVLVVSQKRAALDVVFDRLMTQGFGNFVSLVHDFRGDRKELYKKIAHQISSLENYKELNRSLDAIQLERNLSQLSMTIERHSDFFEEYKNALYDMKECGIPIKELYVTSSFGEETVDLTQYYKHFMLDNMEKVLSDFEAYHGYYKSYGTSSSFWFHRRDFSEMSYQAFTAFKETLNEINRVKTSTEKELREFLVDDFEFGLIYQSFEQKEKLKILKGLLDNGEVYQKFGILMGYSKDSFDLLWLENKTETIRKLFASDGIEWHTPDKEVEETLKKAIHVHEKVGSWWGKVGVKWKANKYGDILELLDKNSLQIDQYGVEALVNKLENRLNLNHQYTLLAQKEWVTLPSKPFEWQEIQDMAKLLTSAIEARFILADVGVLASYLYRPQMPYDRFSNLLNEFIQINDRAYHYIPRWKQHLTDIQLKHLLGTPNEEKLYPIMETFPIDFEALKRFDALRHRLREVDIKLMEKIIDEYPSSSFMTIRKVFISSLRTAWIDHIETKNPVLKEISGPQMKGLLEEYGLAVEEKLKISRFITEMRLREEVCKGLEYNRLNNLITYRDLAHQVTKKKKIWPIKKLIEQYKEEVFKLIPCWLASPETASAILPLEPVFDLVVFDEASQCYFERALPVMLRGKQMVVAGDSKQLQPYDLYKVRLETEEEIPELEVESLLEMSARYFPSFQLQTHYRSSYLPLIHFSNQHFYEGNLYMVPKMDSLNQVVTPLSLFVVEGTWEKQTNKVEAQFTIEKFKELATSFPNESVGIITFNYFQMVLIMELLEKEGILEANQQVKVRNIENVQGDEFDRVIFSVGYAPNPQGKFTANFGMLSRKGGENRLNVAITRARKAVLLISSIKPTDFQPSQLSNPGIKMLRDYLAFVESIHQGEEVKFNTVPVPAFRDRWSLRDKLKGKYGNHEVRETPFYRVMDLEVAEEGKVTTAILTDDQRFFQCNSAKEAFVYHPKMLQDKNWHTLFLFSRQYWLDKEDLLQTKLQFQSQKD